MQCSSGGLRPIDEESLSALHAAPGWGGGASTLR
jgi:hypothetical protein